MINALIAKCGISGLIVTFGRKPDVKPCPYCYDETLMAVPHGIRYHQDGAIGLVPLSLFSKHFALLEAQIVDIEALIKDHKASIIECSSEGLI